MTDKYEPLFIVHNKDWDDKKGHYVTHTGRQIPQDKLKDLIATAILKVRTSQEDYCCNDFANAVIDCLKNFKTVW